MDDEDGAGASYLASLKQSGTSPSAAAKPALTSEASVAASRTYGPAANRPATQSAERRKNPRYRCQGSVHLREVTSDVATWATFTDISVDGCYVEAAAGYGVGANLVLTIEVNGFRVETAAEVRVAYPGLGMGIAFTRITEAQRDNLRKLIHSIPPRSIILGTSFTTQSLAATPQYSAPIANPSAALQAMQKFFEDRHIMGRDEFSRILRKHE
jgi:hypothetical protein